MRVLWMAAELELEFEHVSLEFDDPYLKHPDFLAINPAGAVPAIMDDGFALAESLAINLYLAKRYGASGNRPLYPARLNDEASVWRWTLWAQGHLEPWIQKDALLAELRASMGGHTSAPIEVALTLLNDQLSTRAWLVGEEFTVADLNVAGVLSPSRSSTLDLASFSHVNAWLGRCYERPAAIATRKRFQADS